MVINKERVKMLNPIVTRFGWIKRYMKIVRSDQDYFLKVEGYLRFKLAIAHILIYHAEISRHMSQGLE